MSITTKPIVAAMGKGRDDKCEVVGQDSFASPTGCRLSTVPRSGELRTQKLKSHLVRTQSLNVLPLKPGVRQYIAIHVTLTARDFFLAYFYTSRSIHLHFFQNLSLFFPVLTVANTWFLCRPAE